jgi:hypothetical protein
MIACSAGGDELVDDSEVGTRTQAVHPNFWDPWSSRLADRDIAVDPAICSNVKGYFITVRGSSDNRYYVNSTGFSTNPDWKQFGTRSFNSSPTCTMQSPNPPASGPVDKRFVLAGKSSDNTIWAIEGILPESNEQVPPNPDWTGPWAQVSTTQMAGNNGRPAVASSGTRVGLVYVDNNRLYARYRNLPYGSNSWQPASPIAAPAFPSGAVVSGIPAITWMDGSVDKFVVMVRGLNVDPAVYWIYFSGSAFQGSWAQAALPPPINSDPAMEWDYVFNALTVYWRGDNHVLQASVQQPPQLVLVTAYPMPTPAGAVLSGAPRATFNGGIEGRRAAVIRGYYPAVPTADRPKSYLYAEVNGTPDPFLRP